MKKRRPAESQQDKCVKWVGKGRRIGTNSRRMGTVGSVATTIGVCSPNFSVSRHASNHRGRVNEHLPFCSLKKCRSGGHNRSVSTLLATIACRFSPNLDPNREFAPPFLPASVQVAPGS